MGFERKHWNYRDKLTESDMNRIESGVDELQKAVGEVQTDVDNIDFNDSHLATSTELQEHMIDEGRHITPWLREKIEDDNNAVIHVSVDEPANWERHWWFQDIGTPDVSPPVIPPPFVLSQLNSIRTIELPAGTHQLECWGGNGGATTVAGGVGAYASGTIHLSNPTNIHVGTGQVGVFSGGWSGGGSGGTGPIQSNGGGGATYVTLATDRGLLVDYNQHRSEVIIVAGGGGGGGGGRAWHGTSTAGGAGGAVGGPARGPTGGFGRGGNGNAGHVSNQGGVGGGGGGGGGWQGGNGGAIDGLGGQSGNGGSSYIQTVAGIDPEIPLTHGVMIAGNGAGRPANPNNAQGCVRITTLALPTPPSSTTRRVIMRKQEYGVVHTFLPVDESNTRYATVEDLNNHTEKVEIHPTVTRGTNSSNYSMLQYSNGLRLFTGVVWTSSMHATVEIEFPHKYELRPVVLTGVDDWNNRITAGVRNVTASGFSIGQSWTDSHSWGTSRVQWASFGVGFNDIIDATQMSFICDNEGYVDAVSYGAKIKGGINVNEYEFLESPQCYKYEDGEFRLDENKLNETNEIEKLDNSVEARLEKLESIIKELSEK